MTILQLISSEGFFGAESMLVTLGQSLSRLGCESIVAVFDNSQNRHTEVVDVAQKAGLSTVTIPCEGRWDLSTVSRIRALLTEKSVDVLHSHGYKADLYGYAASRSHEAARISTCHNWPDPSFKMQAYAALNRLALRNFDEIATPSPKVLKILAKSGIESGKLTWIHNGVDVESFRDAAPSLRYELQRGNQPIVGFVGRMVEKKGGVTLLHAAQRVLQANSNVVFTFVGEGPCREEWANLAHELRIDRNVVFTGARQDMASVYASLDVFVLPSFDEAMPMTVLEAMSAGKPVIATRVGAVPELVVEGETGFLCEPGDARAIAQGIQKVLGDSDLAARMGAQGRARVESEFSSDAMGRKYLSLYENAVAERAAGATRSSKGLIA